MSTATTDPQDHELEEKFAQRLSELPKPLQDAIASVNTSKLLQKLAQKHNLHLDTWDSLETEVRLVLFGFQPADELQENIETEVGVPPELAEELAADIFETIFEPVRSALEAELATSGEGPEKAPSNVPLEAETPRSESAQIVSAATPPPPRPTGSIVRAPAPAAPHMQRSHERQDIENDPYREQIS